MDVYFRKFLDKEEKPVCLVEFANMLLEAEAFDNVPGP